MQELDKEYLQWLDEQIDIGEGFEDFVSFTVEEGWNQ